MADPVHTCLYRLRDRLTCKACQAKEREEIRAYIAAVKLEQEQQRIERESLKCDAVPASLAVGCA